MIHMSLRVKEGWVLYRCQLWSGSNAPVLWRRIEREFQTRVPCVRLCQEGRHTDEVVGTVERGYLEDGAGPKVHVTFLARPGMDYRRVNLTWYANHDIQGWWLWDPLPEHLRSPSADGMLVRVTC